MEIPYDVTLARRSLTTSARGGLNASGRTTYRAVLNDIARPARARVHSFHDRSLWCEILPSTTLLALLPPARLRNAG
jgi:hypothetical protein